MRMVVERLWSRASKKLFSTLKANNENKKNDKTTHIKNTELLQSVKLFPLFLREGERGLDFGNDLFDLKNSFLIFFKFTDLSNARTCRNGRGTTLFENICQQVFLLKVRKVKFHPPAYQHVSQPSIVEIEVIWHSFFYRYKTTFGSLPSIQTPVQSKQTCSSVMCRGSSRRSALCSSAP